MSKNVHMNTRTKGFLAASHIGVKAAEVREGGVKHLGDGTFCTSGGRRIERGPVWVVNWF